MWLVAQGQRVGPGATPQRVETQSDWLAVSPHDSRTSGCRRMKEETLFLDHFADGSCKSPHDEMPASWMACCWDCAVSSALGL